MCASARCWWSVMRVRVRRVASSELCSTKMGTREAERAGREQMEGKRGDGSMLDAADGFTGIANLPRGFNWRGFDAYLFDIDGTLLNSRDAVHYEAFLIAMQELYGRTVGLEG